MALESNMIIKNEEININYPCLLICHSTVVLFSSFGKGIVVYTDESNHRLGELSFKWDMTKFTPFRETIQLSNKVDNT